MDTRRWNNANELVKAIRNAEAIADQVTRDYSHKPSFGVDGSSVTPHPLEDEAKAIGAELRTLRKLAAGIAAAEAAS